jgi:two-component system OmpR family sensor kinase
MAARRALSLRARLLVALTILLVAVGLGGYVVARLQYDEIVRQVDRQLANAVPATRAFANRSVAADVRGVDQRAADLRRLPGVPSEFYVGLLGSDGSLQPLVERSLQPEAAPLVGLGDVAARVPVVPVEAPPSAAGGPLAGSGPAGAPGALGPAARPWTVEASDGGTRYRVTALSRRDGTTLVVGLSLDRAEQTFEELLATLAAVGAVVLAVVGLVVWWVMRLGVRPLRTMTEAAVAIAGGDTDRRVAEGPSGTEAGQLARALNAMLDARQQSDDRLRQFVADASHELRTPLTSIRGYVDLYRAGGLDDEASQRDAIRRIGQEAARMNGLVEDLLRLARLDLGRPLEAGPVDLAAIARDAVSDARAVQPERPIHLDAPDAVIVTGDEALLRQAVGAVVANALVHTEGRVPVSVAVRPRDDGATLSVADEGSGMTSEIASRAFDRFFRGDPGRSRHRGGSGLGLAVTHSVVTAHGGTATLSSTPGAGTTVVLRLPVEPPAAPAPA